MTIKEFRETASKVEPLEDLPVVDEDLNKSIEIYEI
jgi:hypothetical protein